MDRPSPPHTAQGEADAAPTRAVPPAAAAGDRAAGRSAGRACPRWSSEALFGAAAEVEISHGGALYRLRRTALGKLILTK